MCVCVCVSCDVCLHPCACLPRQRLCVCLSPRTTAMAHSSSRNSTAFIWHSSGGRCPPHRPPAPKTSRPGSPRSPSSLPKSVSRSSSPSPAGGCGCAPALAAALPPTDGGQGSRITAVFTLRSSRRRQNPAVSRVGLGAAAYTLRFFPGFHCARTSGSGSAGRRTWPAGKTQLRSGVGGQQPENAHER